MQNDKLVAILNDLGLSEKEAKVYFTSLSLGPTTILALSRVAEIKRTTIYSVVESLKQKGLMTIEVTGFKKKFVAEDPEKLESILEIKRKRLHKALPEFSALYNQDNGGNFLKYYEGLEGVKNAYEGVIRDIKPHEEYLAWGNVEKWFELDKEYFRDFVERRAKLRIKTRLLVYDSPTGREWLKYSRNFNVEVRLLSKNSQITTNIVITPQRVLIHQLAPPILCIAIENKNIIHSQREMFEILWNSAAAYTQ